MADNKDKEMMQHLTEMAADLAGYIGVPNINLVRHIAELASSGAAAAGLPPIIGLEGYLAASPKDVFAALRAGGIPAPWVEIMEETRTKYLMFTSICEDKNYHNFIASKMLEAPGPLAKNVEGFKLAQQALESVGVPIPKWESIQKIIDEFAHTERSRRAAKGEPVSNLSETENGIIRKNIYDLLAANTWDAKNELLKRVENEPGLSSLAKSIFRPVVLVVLLQMSGQVVPHYTDKALNAVDQFSENAGAYAYELLHTPAGDGCRKGYTACDTWAYDKPDGSTYVAREFSKGSPIFIRGETTTHYEVASAYDFAGKPEEWGWVEKGNCIFLKEDAPAPDTPPSSERNPIVK